MSPKIGEKKQPLKITENTTILLSFLQLYIALISLEYQTHVNLTTISTNSFYRKLLKAQEIVIQTFSDEHCYCEVIISS